MDSMRCSDGCTPEILLIDFVSHPERTLVMRTRCRAVSCAYASQQGLSGGRRMSINTVSLGS